MISKASRSARRPPAWRARDDHPLNFIRCEMLARAAGAIGLADWW
jgi:hypothetical protein